MDGWSQVQDNATAVLVTDKNLSREGRNVLHMTSTQKHGKAGIRQTVSLQAGKTYVFSAYIKAAEAVMKQGKCSADIKVVTTAGNTLHSEDSDYYETEDGWYRLITSITIPEGTAIKQSDVYVGINGAADVYCDCLQMEESSAASRYNLIDNGDFRRGEESFTKSGTNVYDRAVDIKENTALEVTFRRGIVSDPEVYLRSGPGTNNSIVSSALKGTHVAAIGEGKDVNGTVWYYTYVVKDNQVYTGYMISQFIDFSSNLAWRARTGVVDTASLNLRKGPGTEYGVVASFNRNSTVHIMDYANSSTGQIWSLVYVESGGARYAGYILSDYLYKGAMETQYDDAQANTLDSHAFHMTGNPAGVKKLTQTLNVSGKAGDVYMGNLWGTGFPAAPKDNRAYGLEVEFAAADGTKETYTSNFKADTFCWQFLNDVFIPKKDYTQIKVSCVYSYNVNTVAFDGLALYREDFAESYTYDDKGNIISVQDNAKKKSSFEYDSSNNMNKLVDAKGNSFVYTYDASHNVTGAVSAANVKYTFSYDSHGNPTQSKIVNPANASEFISSSAAYTADGNYVASVSDPLGNSNTYDYDTTKGTLSESSDGMKYSTHYTYDDRGALTSTSKDCTKGFVDDTAEVSYEYENDSLKHINHNGFQYTFEEDGFGNSTNIFVGNKRLIHQEYEGNNGNLSSEQYANGYTYLYKYDRMDRVTQINMKDPAGNEYVLYRYEYDKDGNLATEYDIREDIGRETIVTRYFYDMSGRMVYLRNDRDEDYRYVYDLNDNLVKAMQGNGYRFLQSEYGYDKDNREITSKTANKTYTTTYDALGRVASKAWNTANGFVTQYTYQDGANGSKTSQISKISNKGKDISYKYDKNGNITEISSEEGKITYLYDELGQLVREDNGVLNQTIGYVYDLGGNLYRKKIYDYLPGKDLYFPTEVQPKSEITYAYDNQWKDQLISYNGTAITYDASGNPLQYRGMTFGWKNENELSSVTKGDTSVTYRYNKDGVRNRKYLADGTIVYQLQGNAVVGEQKIGTTTAKPQYELEYFYDSNGNILSMMYNGTEYYYVKNLQGDIIGIIDNQSNTVSGYQYDSWGKLLKITGNQELGKLNPFRYRGYYYDNETELYYLNSRYYDPEVGRFVSADDLAVLDGANDHIIENNLFAYCLNNPVNMSDDDGNWPKWATNLVKVGIGAAAIGIGVAATVATGGAAAPALIASLKIATTSAIVGAVSEAGTSAVKHRISTGSWKGVGKKILRGAVNGAADGFMWGGISAGATFTTVAAKGIKVQQIGKLKPKGKSGNGYFGVQYRNKRNSLKSIELHSPHKSGPHQHWHWQRNTWNPNNGRITGKAKHWTWYGKRMK